MVVAAMGARLVLPVSLEGHHESVRCEFTLQSIHDALGSRPSTSPTFARLRATWMFLDPSSRADVGLAFSFRLEYAT